MRIRGFAVVTGFIDRYWFLCAIVAAGAVYAALVMNRLGWL